MLAPIFPEISHVTIPSSALCAFLAAGDIELPNYGAPGSAGLDLAAAAEPLTIEPGQRVVVGTGLVMLFPPYTEGQIRSRNGLALKHGIVIAHGIGAIDCGYVGEVSVLLLNISDAPYTINRNDRIAQLVTFPVLQVEVSEGFVVPETERGAGGFGSTGKN